MKTTLFILLQLGIMFPLGTLGAVYFAMQQTSNIYAWFFAAWVPVIFALTFSLRSHLVRRSFERMRDRRF